MYKILFALLLLCLQIQVQVQAQSLHITPGARITMAGASNIILNDASLNNEGIFNGQVNSLVKFSGAQSVSVGGTGTSTFSLLQILRASGDLSLSGDITLTGILSLGQGRIQLNNHTLDLTTSGSIIGENNTNYITGTNGGKITATRTFLSTSPQNPGNIGLQMTQTGAQAAAWNITRQHQAESITPDGIVSIQRSFTVTPSKPGPVNLRLRFFYTDSDVFDANENQMVIWNGNGSTFTQLGKDSNNAVANWVDLNNVHITGHFVLANPTVPGGGATMGARRGLAQNAPSAQLTTATEIKIYPNPVHDNFAIDLTVADARTRTFELFDPSGRLLQKKEIFCPTGHNTIPWSLNATAPGVYFLVIDHGSLKNIKIVKE